MSDLIEYTPTYGVTFFGEEEPVTLNENQYQTIKTVINKDKFIEIKGTLYNTSSIKNIHEVKVGRDSRYPLNPEPVERVQPSAEATEKYERWKELPSPKPKYIDWCIQQWVNND